MEDRDSVRVVIVDEWAALRGGVSLVLGACGVNATRQASTASGALAEPASGAAPEVVIFGLDR